MSQPTLRWEGEAKSQRSVFQKRKHAGVATKVYSKKTSKKPKNKVEGLRILKMRVQELFTHREGISTPRARRKGQQPLIRCAKHDFKIVYFPLFMFFLYFWGRQGCCPCSYVSSGAMRNSDLYGSLSLKVYVLH